MRVPDWVDRPDEKPFRPWVPVWLSMSSGESHHGDALREQERKLADLLDALVDFACNSELVGYLPGRLVVQDEHAARYLTNSFVGMGIEVELRDELFGLELLTQSLENQMLQHGVAPGLLATEGVDLELVRAFAHAAAEFHRARPWERLSPDDLIQIDSPVPDPQLRCTTVLGACGHYAGVAFFDSPWSHDWTYVPKDPRVPEDECPYSLLYGPVHELPYQDADLWEEHALPVAAADAYPRPAHMLPQDGWETPAAPVLRFMEGLLRALARTTEDEMDSGRWTKTVATSEGAMRFELSMPELFEPIGAPVKWKERRLVRPFSMERDHVQDQRLMEEKGFTSSQELWEFKDQYQESGASVPHIEGRTPLEKAQDVAYDALQSRRRRSMQLARKALEIHPDCADAYVVLAGTATTTERALELYEKGEAVGRRALGAQVFEEQKGRFWHRLETRPFMRAKLGAARCLEKLGRTEEAIARFQELLELDPIDGQGVRLLLTISLLGTNQIEELAKHLGKYAHDDVALTRYCHALVIFMLEGDTAASRKQLGAAKRVNWRVPKYLLRRVPLPPELPVRYLPGSDFEAMLCANSLMQAWESTRGAIAWLERSYRIKQRSRRRSSGRRR